MSKVIVYTTRWCGSDEYVFTDDEKKSLLDISTSEYLAKFYNAYGVITDNADTYWEISDKDMIVYALNYLPKGSQGTLSFDKYLDALIRTFSGISLNVEELILCLHSSTDLPENINYGYHQELSLELTKEYGTKISVIGFQHEVTDVIANKLLVSSTFKDVSFSSELYEFLNTYMACTQELKDFFSVYDEYWTRDGDTEPDYDALYEKWKAHPMLNLKSPAEIAELDYEQESEYFSNLKKFIV